MAPQSGARAYLLPLLLIACGACGIDTFELVLEDRATISGTVQDGPLATGLQFGGRLETPSFESEQAFQNHGVSPDDVDAIYVQSITIEGANPAIDRLDILLESVEVRVSADDVATLSLERGADFPAPTTQVELVVVPDLNIKAHATAKNPRFSAMATIKQPPALPTTLITTVRLLVDINVLGI